MLLELLVAMTISAIPPVEYRGDHMATVAFISSNITRNELCTTYVQRIPPAGWEWKGCASKESNLMIVPNPCAYKEESYARHVCHELGHLNGWPGDHPNGEEYKFPQIFEQTNPKK